MSKKTTIDKWSFRYLLAKYILVKPIHDLYYRKIQIQNHSNIPRNAPVILAPNHQNALMDAIAFVSGINFQTVFLARADVFTSKFVIKLLTFCKILPVYRIRDGRANLQKNDEIFETTIAILHNHENPLCLYPEGNHGNRRRLRPLVKGIFRIAFQAQEEYGSKPGVKIIPIGLDYKHYQKFRQTQFINIGNPIEVSEYWDAYTENQAIGINLLRDRLSDELKKLMIHIETEEYYELYMSIKSLYSPTLCRKMGLKPTRLSDNFIASKKIIAALDKCLESDESKIAGLNKKFSEYKSLREDLKLRDWVPQRKKYNLIFNLFALIFSVFLLPVVLLGIFNNWPHYFLPPKILKGIKDLQFHSTAKWGAGFAIIIVYYLILIIVGMVFIPFWWLKLTYVLTLPVTGIVAFKYRNFVVKTWAKIRYTWKVMVKDCRVERFQSLYAEIMNTTGSIVDSE
jgi:1-acyl-sn-glycerol-3-phosphate acyltransferase